MYDCVISLWACTFPHLVFIPERNLGIQNSGLGGCLYVAMCLPTSGNKPQQGVSKGLRNILTQFCCFFCCGQRQITSELTCADSSLNLTCPAHLSFTYTDILVGPRPANGSI